MDGVFFLVKGIHFCHGKLESFRIRRFENAMELFKAWRSDGEIHSVKIKKFGDGRPHYITPDINDFLLKVERKDNPQCINDYIRAWNTYIMECNERGVNVTITYDGFCKVTSLQYAEQISAQYESRHVIRNLRKQAV